MLCMMSLIVMSDMATSKVEIIYCLSPGVDPGVGKGRGTNRLSCKWLGESQIL